MLVFLGKGTGTLKHASYSALQNPAALVALIFPNAVFLPWGQNQMDSLHLVGEFGEHLLARDASLGFCVLCLGNSVDARSC